MIKALPKIFTRRMIAKTSFCFFTVAFGLLVGGGCTNRIPQSPPISSPLSGSEVPLYANTPTPLKNPFNEPLFYAADNQSAFALANVSRTMENLVLLFPVTGEIRNLANMGSYSVSCSPDGEWIAFDGTAEIPHVDLYIIHPDGSELTQLTSDSLVESYPDWAPTGDEIVFVSRGEDNLMGHLAIININNREVTFLSNLPEDVSYPSWSPDGAYIAYLSGGNSYSSYASLEVRDIVTGFNHSVHSPIIQGPVDWSEDGQWIAYIAPNGLSYRCGDIHAIHFRDNRIIEITHGQCVTTFRWSPRGNYIAYVGIDNINANVMDMGAQVYILQVDTGDTIRLTSEREWQIRDLDWLVVSP